MAVAKLTFLGSLAAAALAEPLINTGAARVERVQLTQPTLATRLVRSLARNPRCLLSCVSPDRTYWINGLLSVISAGSYPCVFVDDVDMNVSFLTLLLLSLL